MAEHRWPAFPTGHDAASTTNVRSCYVLAAAIDCAHAGRVEPRTRGDPQRHPHALQPEGARRPRANGSTRSRRSTACRTRRTTVTIEHPKSILTRNSSPDIGFDRSINAYRGCEHGCIYCFARPTHAYHDLSPGVDFESRLFVKPNAAQLLHAALSRPGYECRPIAMGTNTDPYQPIEERWRITRSVIELLLETRHPFTITTKSDRVLRDLDLLEAGRGPAASRRWRCR